ncbi:unnamed protein product, partial [Ectocarpus sp. 12 AP-2014]
MDKHAEMSVETCRRYRSRGESPVARCLDFVLMYCCRLRSNPYFIREQIKHVRNYCSLCQAWEKRRGNIFEGNKIVCIRTCMHRIDYSLTCTAISQRTSCSRERCSLLTRTHFEGAMLAMMRNETCATW